MANTAAYNANEVAAVYMSLNRDDLLSSDEGGNKLAQDVSLKNGFYGLSDPLNLRGVLESFEYDVASQNRGSYRIRVLNPTSELETILMGFYSKLFPDNLSTFKTFKDESEREARWNAVEAIAGQGALPEYGSLPEIYLRFGYGTNAQSGLSRIHKCRMFDLKYMVSEQADRVIEIHAVDSFSYTKLNPRFNKRQYVVRTRVSYELTGKDAGKFALKKPSVILTETFASYLTYPQCVPAVDLGSYADSIDELVYSVAKALAEADVLSKNMKRLKEEGFSTTPSEAVAATSLTAKEIKAFEDLLDRPLVPSTQTNRKAVGNVTPHILYQAFKMVFESIGMKWEMNPVGSPEPITGPLSPDQRKDSNIPPAKSANDQHTPATVANYSVNIKTEWLWPKRQARYTKVASVEETHWNGHFRLSFWPLVLESGTVRQLTQEEKLDPAINPIWLNPGMVNLENYKPYSYKTTDENYKYSFPFAELKPKYSHLMDLGTLGSGGRLKPIPVSIPLDGFWLRTVPGINLSKTLIGPQTNVTEPNPYFSFNPEDKPKFCTPLIDMNPGSWNAETSRPRTPGSLFRYDLFHLLPMGTAIRRWAEAANRIEYYAWDFMTIKGYEPWMTPSLQRRADNPPIIYLEPTVETAKWFSLNYQNQDKMVQERISEQAKGFQELIGWTGELMTSAFGHLGSFSSLIPKLTKAQRFSLFLDKYTNAYVSMGDDGQHQDISGFLTTTLNKLNRLLIGKSTKMRIEQVQVNMLSVEDKKALSDNSTLFKDVTWDEVWANKDWCIILAMPGAEMKKHYGDQVIRPILSFPQTYSVDTGAKYMFLDYGTPNSIIAKLEFTSDNRPLINIAQSLFSVRQFNDVKQLFDGTLTLSTTILTKIISEILSKKISTLSTTPTTEITLAALDSEQYGEKISKLNSLRESLGDLESSMEINDELLTLLPELLEGYQINGQTGEDPLEEIITPNEAQQIRKLASLVSDAEWLNFLFPDANIDGKDNTLTTEVLMVNKGTLERKEIKKRILRRRVDLEGIRNRLSDKERKDKMTDTAYNYSVAMQQESFELKITTLGIPEIDDPASEFLTRRVCLKYYDPRLASGALHWLSGVYRITAFKHRLNPSQGFMTELTMQKEPKVSLSNIQDTR